MGRSPLREPLQVPLIPLKKFLGETPVLPGVLRQQGLRQQKQPLKQEQGQGLQCREQELQLPDLGLGQGSGSSEPAGAASREPTWAWSLVLAGPWSYEST